MVWQAVQMVDLSSATMGLGRAPTGQLNNARMEQYKHEMPLMPQSEKAIFCK